jgi:hypothetical protein
MSIKGKISLKELLGLDPSVIDGLKDAIEFEIVLEVAPDGEGNFVKLIPKIHDKWTDGFSVGDISEIPGLDKYITESQEEHGIMHQSELFTFLVKMADKFDRQGEFELAEKIDETLQSLAARPKAPLKNLDDDVKKNLIIFLHNADKNTKDSMKGLNEFFRRLRYFDVASMIKEMGLDKVINDMSKTQSCLDEATKKFYELTHGKKPSKVDLEDYLDDGDSCKDCGCQDSALDFFDSQADKAEDKDSETEKEVELEVEVELDEEDLGEIEEALKTFWDEDDGNED